MKRTITAAEWRADAVRRFGDDEMQWAFECPICKHVATVSEYQAAGAPVGAVGFSCIGRWMKSARDAFGGEGPGPCNYTGGGLFRLNPVTVIDGDREHSLFEFAPVATHVELIPQE